ncbi:hypothetical protein COX64_01760 [Candidatus Dojkabacteria bacterium CG_4_10_14_0_2_um_filter_Dojkabacteria_WS6_41_15]|uniref:Uncharacterized protein n=1 Tax=Candidatus Dojkabacteria bacterium CG_4_10_14_0_2_um_filter_Dojkabacteria_WS6_41_15 TaxID=2014249 RepID=A0A2M7W2E6_9BACT|nr:MAG: hypothetical protein COX64_01760 [Candidatus Dojkabacteria bacterium CG_4_10_14_0_2_um_filter_Dojkabacteria_WS6_41_15]
MNIVMIIGASRSWKVFAQTMPLLDGGETYTPEADSFFNKVLVIAVALSVMIAVIMVAASGYTILTSGGDAAKLKDAKEQLQNAILGLLLILGAVTIVGIVFNLLGISGVF